MADRDVSIDIIANDKTDRGTRSAIKNFQDLDKQTSRITKNLQKDMIGNGTKLGALLGQNVAKGLSRVAPAIGPVLAGAVLASLPFLGASVAGAIIGTAGVGGVIGGLVLASRSPQVQNAGERLGNFIMSSLSAKASVFIEPTLQAIQTIESKFGDVSDNIGRILESASRFVGPLVSGVTVFVERVTSGLARLTANAGPVIDAISVGVALVGTEIERMFNSLADNGASAALAVRQAFQLLAAAIRVVGITINALTEAYGVLAKLGAFGRDAQLEFIRLEANAKLAGRATWEMGAGLDSVRSAGSSAAGAISTLVGQIGSLTQANNTLYASQTSAAEAIARTSASIRENGRTLDLNTEKGRANRQALSNLAQSLNAQYEATVKVNGAGRVSDGVASRNRESFVRLATQLTGSASKARALADQLLGIPKKADTKVNADTKAANSAVNAYQGNLAAIPRSITTTVTTRYKGDGSNQNSPSIGGGGGRKFSANTFASAGSDAGSFRTGGPQAVTPSIKNDVSVYVDGEPVRAYVRESRRDERYRTTVGRRYANA